MSIQYSMQVILRDTDYNILARFDSWQSLEYTKGLNGVDTLSFAIPASDSRCSLFGLDYLIEVMRSIKGIGLFWYQEFIGLHRKSSYSCSDSGVEIFTSNCLGLGDFLARTSINYPAATIKSYKWDKSETCIKQYVEENCGSSATTGEPNERVSNGVLKDFYVDSDRGRGSLWEGDKAGANLLETIKAIADLDKMDFSVTWDSSSKIFLFKVYDTQLGSDRTITGLDLSTGKNLSGNSPLIFSLQNSNISSMNYSEDRSSEANIVSVLGDGDGATRIIVCMKSPAWRDSVWNRREISRPLSGYQSEMETGGKEALADNRAKNTVTVTPLPQESCAYGKHYFLGDNVTARVRGRTFNARIISIRNNCSEKENVSIELEDLTPLLEYYRDPPYDPGEPVPSIPPVVPPKIVTPENPPNTIPTDGGGGETTELSTEFGWSLPIFPAGTGFAGPPIQIPFDCQIDSVRLVAVNPGNISIDLWMNSFLVIPATIADSIVGATPPTLVGAQTYEDTELTGWKITWNKEDWLWIYITSWDTILSVSISFTGHILIYGSELPPV